jgi:hypothetical protein
MVRSFAVNDEVYSDEIHDSRPGHLLLPTFHPGPDASSLEAGEEKDH